MDTLIDLARRFILRQQSVPPGLVEDMIAELLLRATEQDKLTERGLYQLAPNVVRDVYWTTITPLSGMSGVTAYKYRDILAKRSASLDSTWAEEGWFAEREQAPPSDDVHIDLSCLTDAQREVIHLLYFEPSPSYSGVGRPSDNLSGWGLTASEASRRLGITEAAVRARQKSALKRLREAHSEQ